MFHNIEKDLIIKSQFYEKSKEVMVLWYISQQLFLK